jgi:hypothetical protein
MPLGQSTMAGTTNDLTQSMEVGRSADRFEQKHNSMNLSLGKPTQSFKASSVKPKYLKPLRKMSDLKPMGQLRFSPKDSMQQDSLVSPVQHSQE